MNIHTYIHTFLYFSNFFTEGLGPLVPHSHAYLFIYSLVDITNNNKQYLHLYIQYVV